MIRNREELKFYIMADYMMNRGYFKPSFIHRVRGLVLPDYVMQYLVAMRKVAYFSRKNRIDFILNKLRYRRLGIKLGFSIGPESFGYGLVIPHYGSIVVGDSNRCGNFCVLHTSTCISGNGKEIGDALYLSAGSVITSKIVLGNNVTVGANSVVNKSFPRGNALLVGAPAAFKADRAAWYDEEEGIYKQRVEAINQLKIQMIP